MIFSFLFSYLSSLVEDVSLREERMIEAGNYIIRYNSL